MSSQDVEAIEARPGAERFFGFREAFMAELFFLRGLVLGYESVQFTLDLVGSCWIRKERSEAPRSRRNTI